MKSNNSQFSILSSQLMLLFAVLLLVGCKSSKTVVKVPEVAQQYLSSKLELTIPHGDAVFTVNGTMKMKEGELVQMSLLMPLFRSSYLSVDG